MSAGQHRRAALVSVLALAIALVVLMVIGLDLDRRGHGPLAGRDTIEDCATQMLGVGVRAIADADAAGTEVTKIDPDTLSECNGLSKADQQQAADTSRGMWLGGTGSPTRAAG